MGVLISIIKEKMRGKSRNINFLEWRDYSSADWAVIAREQSGSNYYPIKPLLRGPHKSERFA